MTRRSRSLAVSLALHGLAVWAWWRVLAPDLPVRPMAVELFVRAPVAVPASPGRPAGGLPDLEKPMAPSPVSVPPPVVPPAEVAHATAEQMPAAVLPVAVAAPVVPVVPSMGAVPAAIPSRIVPALPVPAVAAVPAADDVPATVLRQTAPRYPRRARAARREGAVDVCFEVDATGVVRHPRAAGDAAEVAWFGAAACEAVAAWSFAPARRAGRPVACQARVRVRFSLDR